MNPPPASACVLARDAAHVVADVVGPLTRLRDDGVLQRVVLVDLGSTDATVAVGVAAGADALDVTAVHPELGPVLGKGDAIWRAAQALEQDALVFVDGDLRCDLHAGVPALLAPLAADPTTVLVKGRFARVDADGRPTGGGRVTELTARPLLNLLLPELTALHEPLSGQVAVRRAQLQQLEVVTGWGVEIAMLLDVVGRWGLDAVAEADLGVIEHDPPGTEALHEMATHVMATLLDRAAAAGVVLTAEQAAGVAAHLPPARGPVAPGASSGSLGP